MHASDIALIPPTVTMDDSVARAVRSMAVMQVPGVVVVDDDERPLAVLPGTKVLSLVIPGCYQSGPTLARAVDEVHADLFWQESAKRTVRDCLPSPVVKPTVVEADANLLEVATAMAKKQSPLVAVVDDHGRLTGAVTLARLLTSLGVAALGD